MNGILLSYEPVIRLGTFTSLFAVMALWEMLAPRRRQAIGRFRRWPGNIGVAVLNTLLVRLVFPAAAIGMALLAEAHGWGLFQALSTPDWLAIAASVVFLDLAIYFQHVLFHAVPSLWRLHRMHHADLEFDVTTGVRFHPIEILLSMAIKLGVVAALGAPAVAVLIFEVLLNATSMFNHGNVHLTERLDAVLRRFVVTPDMHRVHHSVTPLETNSNFGFNLPCWDRLFGTYRAQPLAGHQEMMIGIAQFRDARELRLDRMLLQPLRDEPRWIEVQELAGWIKDGGAVVIDVRGADEFTGPLGHIDAALNLPVAELPDRLIEINALKDKPIILVCQTDKRSAKAAAFLKDAGFRDARVLRGGMERWNQNALPAEDRAPAG